MTTLDAGRKLQLELFDAAGNLIDQGIQRQELLVNGSFETGVFNPWITAINGSPFRPWSINAAGFGGGFSMQPTQPQDGAFVAWNGFDGASSTTEFTLSQVVTIPASPPTSR